jgi:hypothetical protein
MHKLDAIQHSGQSGQSGLLAATFYQSRETARSLLGERYSGRMQELGAVLQRVASNRRTGTFDAAQDVIRAADLYGFEAIQVVAAAVELAEPSRR